MKHLTTLLCLALLNLVAVNGKAQNIAGSRPALFASFPSSIDISAVNLDNIFAIAEKQNVNVSLANGFVLSGPVTSKLAKYSNLQTMVIRLLNFSNTLFSLSKQTDQNNNSVFVGRILNPLYADGFELQQKPDGNYQLIKTDTEKIFVTCNQ